MHSLSEGLEICFAHLLRLMHAPVRMDARRILAYVSRSDEGMRHKSGLPFMSSTFAMYSLQ